jgi:hypothetical protein
MTTAFPLSLSQASIRQQFCGPAKALGVVQPVSKLKEAVFYGSRRGEDACHSTNTSPSLFIDTVSSVPQVG